MLAKFNSPISTFSENRPHIMIILKRRNSSIDPMVCQISLSSSHYVQNLLLSDRQIALNELSGIIIETIGM